ncbi:MAG: tetratricopeptide repeat protein [Gammaproteobacteria bacterium]|nr:tetratricopeptide repeat protein [Gammaproteobacteria bacterium]
MNSSPHLNHDFTLAHQLHQTQQWDLARAAYQKILQSQPQHPVVMQLMAQLELQVGNYAQALLWINQLIVLFPQEGNFYHHRGVIYKQNKDTLKAIENFTLALQYAPNHTLALNDLGNSYLDLKEYEKALDYFQKALQVNAHPAEIYRNIGYVYKEWGQFSQALEWYGQAIQVNPSFAEAYSNRAYVYGLMKNYTAALNDLDLALRLDPKMLHAYNNMGGIYKELNQLDQALSCFAKAIALDRQHPPSILNYGMVLSRQGHYLQAIEKFDEVLKLSPLHRDAYINKGLSLCRMHQLSSSIECFNQALSIDPESDIAKFNQSMVLLLDGQYAQAWPLYEYRWVASQNKMCDKLPAWDGHATLENKRILVYAEQGFGDTIQFCRYIPKLAELGAEVSLWVPPALVTLCQNLPNLRQCLPFDYEWGTVSALEYPYDYAVALLSLPGLLRTELATIPSRLAYLCSSPLKREYFSQRLGESRKPKVGLAFSGNSAYSGSEWRNIPLATLLPYLSDNIQWVSLQKTYLEADAAVLKTSTIVDFSQELSDFLDTAALCEVMDLIISVDTSVAHLSAALGKPTSILLPYNPDWRWLLGRTDSPWYASVRLCRQPKLGDWDSVLSDVFTHLLPVNLPS